MSDHAARTIAVVAGCTTSGRTYPFTRAPESNDPTFGQMTPLPIIRTESDFAEAAEDMGIPNVDFSEMSDAEVEAAAAPPCPPKGDRGFSRCIAARWELLTRRLAGSVP